MMYAQLSIWIVIALVISGLILWRPKGLFLYFIAILIVFSASFVGAVKERAQYFEAIHGIPNIGEEFEFNYVKVVWDQKSDEYYVLLWITMVDKDDERLYIFPYESNKQLKKDLDKMARLQKDGRLTEGPFEITNEPSGDPLFEKIRKKKNPNIDIKENIENE